MVYHPTEVAEAELLVVLGIEDGRVPRLVGSLAWGLVCGGRRQVFQHLLDRLFRFVAVHALLVNQAVLNLVPKLLRQLDALDLDSGHVLLLW